VTALRRHALVWLSQAPRADDEPDGDLVADWYGRARPFVVCRRRGAGDDLSLGFCSPVTGAAHARPRRVAAQSAATHVLRVEAPPALGEVARRAGTAPQADALARLADDASGLAPRVFGSWMWQTVTGDAHVRDGSDLDILVEVASAEQAHAAAAVLERLSRGLPFRLDGELSIAGVGEVMWREYRGDGAEVLVKSVDAVRVLPREALWA